MDIRGLVEVINNNKGEEIIKAILPNGEIVEVGQQQYVESNVYYMFKKDMYAHSLISLRTNLEMEADDECWRTTIDGIFDSGKSDFLDCEVMFANCYCEDFEEVAEENLLEVKGITVEDGVVYLHCEDGYAEEIANEVTVTLTVEEMQMIKEALNHYGDRKADTHGYSLGEPYWDLMNKLNCNVYGK